MDFISLKRLRRAALALAVCALLPAASAQTRPAYDLAEPANPEQPDTAAWAKVPRKLTFRWASTNELFRKHAVPQTAAIGPILELDAWRGERASAVAVLYAPTDLGTLRMRCTSALGEGAVTPHPLRYVLTDDFKACGKHPGHLPAWLVPDALDPADAPIRMEAMTTRPVWLTIEVPRNARAGDYAAKIEAVDEQGRCAGALILKLRVIDRTLPAPSAQRQHIDFWQQPYGVARYYGVERWSREHFDLLRPYMELLARAGQRVVTAFLFHEPWGDQSFDKHSAMVGVTKRRDGTWLYNYDVFDRWVEFMASCGIDGQISCYSMVPWDMTFRYFDEASGRDVDLKTSTSAPEYRELWLPFLRAFAAHLKAKGWYEKTCIAMDERGLEAVLNACAIVQEAAPGMKMAMAGNYHAELADKLYDYCIAYEQSWPDSVLAERRAKGWKSTWYTCCSTPEPSLFSNADPIEPAWLGLHNAAMSYDGYLHWSWLNWNADPLHDTRWRLFSPGDTFIVYPGGRSSVRWERFIEGIQQAEKYYILRDEYAHLSGSDALKTLKALDAALAPFASRHLPADASPSELLRRLKSEVNK